MKRIVFPLFIVISLFVINPSMGGQAVGPIIIAGHPKLEKVGPFWLLICEAPYDALCIIGEGTSPSDGHPGALNESGILSIPYHNTTIRYTSLVQSIQPDGSLKFLIKVEN
ncbi:MAG TPA: hypothetical protein PLM70_09795 [Bacteroidales bacterium]|nr:hypothetical protein [Bacteroidales bacterium]